MESAHILSIHVAGHGRDHRDFQVESLARATDGFSGAELEQVVVSALYEAFAKGEQARLEDRHLEAAIEKIVPFSRSAGPKIGRMREQAKAWRMASVPEKEGEEGLMEMAEAPPVACKKKRVFEV